MKNRILLLNLIVCFIAMSASAQIDLEHIAKKTQRSVNKRVERGIERGVDDVLDSAEDQVRGKNKKKKKKNGNTYDEPEVVVVKEIIPYSFSGNMTVAINSNGWTPENMVMVVCDEYELALRPMLVKEPNNLMIYNKEEESITKINNQQYSGKALKEYMEYEALTDTNTEFEKTSDIEEFHGYIARKYVVEGDGYEGVAWMSTELDVDFDLFTSMMQYPFLALSQKHGFPLKMEIEFKNGDEFSFDVLEITDGSPSKELLNVSDYDLIDMTDLKSGN